MIYKESCFGIHLTFGIQNVDNNIFSFIDKRKKGYVCVVDFNVISRSFQDSKYNRILNNADFNLKSLGDVDTSTLADGGILQFRSSDGKFVLRNELEETVTGALTLNAGNF